MDIQTMNQYKERGLLMNQVHPTLPLIIWNYTPECTYSGAWDEITLMCRGLVTDTDGNIVSRGFPKFFNLEEGKHEPTDQFEVFEKLDGQYIGVFWYKYEVMVDGCPFQKSEMIVNSRGSFNSIYALEATRILNEKWPKFVKYPNRRLSYCFELTGFEQIVVSYPEPELTLTGVFSKDGTEMNLEIFEEAFPGSNLVKKFDGLDWKNIKQLNWKNSEGFVVRFSNGSRCKIKFEDYIKLHRQMTNLSTCSIWKALAAGEPVSSILNDVPDEFYDKVHKYETELKRQYSEIEEISKLYFEYFSPWLVYRRKLFVQKCEQLLINPYLSIVLSMIDNKNYSKIIWQYLEPKFEKI